MMKLPKIGYNKTQSYIEFETTFGKVRFGVEGKGLFYEKSSFGASPEKVMINDAWKRFDTIEDKAANFTIELDKENTLYLANSDVDEIQVELPLHATAAIPVNSVYTVGQKGTQVFEFVGEAGVTVRGGAKSWEQYTLLNAVKVAEDEWWIIGGSDE
jgi:hypothetical protein